MNKRKILIIGEVFVDQHLDIKENGVSISRLGGIFHAVRACDALNVEFAFAYYAPNYLEKDIMKYGIEVLGASKVYCLGFIDKSPNVMLIGQSDESGNQLYDNILCNQAEFIYQASLQQVIDDFLPSDVMIFPGRYGNDKIMSELVAFEGKIHIDMNYDCDDILELVNENIETVFLSTSSISFKEYFIESSYERLVEYFRPKNVHQVLIKENRGGSWIYDFRENKSYEAPAFIGLSIHSVGVGDVYDIAYICELCTSNIIHNMVFASWMASSYAQTLQHKLFKENVNILSQNIDEIVEMEGIRVPWNERKNYPIYMAAPDFDYIDTKQVDVIADALSYHNFMPRLPIRENGQANADMASHEELDIFYKDIALLNECKLMIAILLYNDQGTLVEIGTYQAKGKPVILYDPYKKLDNMFLKHSCSYYCNTVSDVINTVFEVVSGMVNNGK